MAAASAFSGMGEQRVVAEGFEFPEGPAIGPDGEWYVAEMRGARISRVDREGRRSLLAPIDGSPGAVAFGPDDALYVTNNPGRRFVDGRPRGVSSAPPGRIERVTLDGTVETLFDRCDSVPLNAPNDLCFDARGGFYFTDPANGDLFADDVRWPEGHVYYARCDGSAITRVASGYELCNGLAVTDDQRRLLVCETLTGIVWLHEIRDDGGLSQRTRFGQLPPGDRPDGCCLDAAGNLICAAVGTGALAVIDPEGRSIARIPVEDAGVTNVAFGGPGLRTLHLTEGYRGRLSCLPWPHAGMALHPDRNRRAA